MELAQPLHQCVNQRTGVEVIGMDLVENDNLAGQPELPHEEMLRRHHSQERLIHRSHAERGEESALRRRKPGPTHTHVLFGLGIGTGRPQPRG